VIYYKGGSGGLDGRLQTDILNFSSGWWVGVWRNLN
jgi:hypothetical protein